MARRTCPDYHPGEVLQSKFLTPIGLSIKILAQRVNLSTSCVEHIITGQQSITGDSASRFAKFFNTSPDYWLQLQEAFDASQIKHMLNYNEKNINTYQNQVLV